MKKIRVKAHPVQGLTCFHEYKDSKLKTLTVDMLYATIGALETVTELELSTPIGRIVFEGKIPPLDVEQRIKEYMGKYTKENFQVTTSTNFDSDIGLASSASGYSCLAGGLAKLLNLTSSYKNISKMARIGSFSASASVPGGLVLVRNSEQGEETFGEQIYSPNDLEDVTIVIAKIRHDKKRFDFYKEATTSPLLENARELTKNAAIEMIDAFGKRDIDKLAYLSERHVMLNYAVLTTGENSSFLWKPESIKAIEGVRRMRSDGLPMFYSMNTGAVVFTYCFNDTAVKAMQQYLQEEGIDCVISKIGGGLQYV